MKGDQHVIGFKGIVHKLKLCNLLILMTFLYDLLFFCGTQKMFLNNLAPQWYIFVTQKKASHAGLKQYEGKLISFFISIFRWNIPLMQMSKQIF